ncbi:MAG TPA: hypothetical protein VFT39_25820 [Vicinamibacterales bacterium]|nr:hypothetical protein [Vicinamibacterales bacterium]
MSKAPPTRVSDTLLATRTRRPRKVPAATAYGPISSVPFAVIEGLPKCHATQ